MGRDLGHGRAILDKLASRDYGRGVNRALLCVALVACAFACKDKEEPVAVEATQAVAPETVQPPTVADAGKQPSADDAALVVRSFSEKLLKNDLAGAREELRVPAQFKDKQVDFFLQELQAPANMSTEGVARVLEGDFGPLAERFGDQAPHVAATLGLDLASLYAFGDTKAAALVHWDGTRFRVAAVHRLAAP